MIWILVHLTQDHIGHDESHTHSVITTSIGGAETMTKGDNSFKDFSKKSFFIVLSRRVSWIWLSLTIRNLSWYSETWWWPKLVVLIMNSIEFEDISKNSQFTMWSLLILQSCFLQRRIFLWSGITVSLTRAKASLRRCTFKCILLAFFLLTN
jgi:hypothetical protein